MPLYGNGYSLPIDDLRVLNVPVINVGPIGKDAHQWTERIDLQFAFETLADLLPYTICKLLR